MYIYIYIYIYIYVCMCVYNLEAALINRAVLPIEIDRLIEELTL